jgi:hypothetical protein
MLPRSTLWKTFFVATLWINASEVFRYFVVVMPAMRRDLAVLPGVAPMSWPVFSIWGIWDTVLTVALMGASWLFYQVRSEEESAFRIAFKGGTALWVAFFVLFWLGMVNMNLARPSLALAALPLAWIEMVVAARLAVWGYDSFRF